MSRNVGTADRWVRVLLGLGLLSLTLVGPKSLWGLIGLIPFVTGVVSFCPLYSVLGWSSSRHPRTRASR